MFRMGHSKPWTVIGVISWGNFFIFTEKYSFIHFHRINHVLKPPKIMDLGYLQFMFESVPTMIGFRPKLPSNRIEKNRLSLA